jgi:hypothetical protein
MVESKTVFLRVKSTGPYHYLQVVENHWAGRDSRQRVVATLGRLDQLQESGKLDGLLASAARFSEQVLVLVAHRNGDAVHVRSQRIGHDLVFERLWRESGCQAAIDALLAPRKFGFPVERAIYLEVLHRLINPGSDRDGYQWRDAYAIGGTEDLDLHHAYRAMAWLGEPMPAPEGEPTRCVKDAIEERLFEHRRNLFSSLEIVFFDTTSLYFEGDGGAALGQRGHSKDARPDLRQMIVGVVLDEEGRPLCTEMWPGNTADVTALLPVAARLSKRFGVGRACLVADRGMISARTVKTLDDSGWPYILGARMRSQSEVRDDVLGRAGRYRQIVPPRQQHGDPSPLEVKEVWVEDRRYVICRNRDQATKDAADRETIVASLSERLASQGSKSLVGNSGFRRYLRQRGSGGFVIDAEKVEAEARYDGKWVLRTNTDWDAGAVAQHYKQLWMVEAAFRNLKSLLATRPIFHKTDETIKGHVFCSFLALLLRRELLDRLDRQGQGAIEWGRAMKDLDRLELIEVEHHGQRYQLRSETTGVAGKVLQAAHVALPPTLLKLPPVAEPGGAHGAKA